MESRIYKKCGLSLLYSYIYTRISKILLFYFFFLLLILLFLLQFLRPLLSLLLVV